jgi:hypothetical protein
MEQIKRFAERAQADGELTEEQLVEAAGGREGGLTQNRYDPNVCPRLTRTRYECVGFLGGWLCDHYRRSIPERDYDIYKHQCAMGAFDYKGDEDGNR